MGCPLPRQYCRSVRAKRANCATKRANCATVGCITVLSCSQIFICYLHLQVQTQVGDSVRDLPRTIIYFQIENHCAHSYFHILLLKLKMFDVPS